MSTVAARDDEYRQAGWRTLGHRISAARRDAGLSQGELAKHLDTRLWTVVQLEEGRRDPVPYLAALRAIFNLQSLGLRPSGIGAAEASAATAGGQSNIRSVRRPQEVLSGRNLVLGALAALIVIRLFTEKIPLLPGPANFVDVPLMFLLVGAAVVRSPTRSHGPFFLPALLFLAVCTLSTVANLSRVDIGPVLLFVYGFLAPLAFYFAAYRLWQPGHAVAISRVIVGLVLLEFFVVAAIDVPSFARTRNPDDISGTFGENAYQLVFFLIVAASLVAGIATFERRRLAARFAPALIGGSFLVIFLAQYRALLVTTALSAVLVAFFLARVRGRGLLTGALVVIACAVGLSYVATYFPVTKFSSTLSALRQDPVSFLQHRLAPVTRVSTLFAQDPAVVATGTGPGTYSSRAWRTFARPDTRDRDPASQVASALTGGRRYSTDVSNRYTLEQYRNAGSILGSRALESPFSSYSSLLAEVGVLGFILLIGMYAFAVWHAGRMTFASMRSRLPDDALPALLLAATVAFFLLLQMAALDNWLEVTRVTVPAWILLAVGTKEFDARRVERSVVEARF